MNDNLQKVKIPPNSKESEMMVLGCMLTSINSLNVGADSLEDNDFYFTEHKLIFDCLKMAYRNDKPADVHLIAEELKRQNKLQNVGGVAYLTTLAQYAGTSAYTEEYVEIVRGKALLRRIIQAAQKIEKEALDDPPDVRVCLDDAQASFFQIGQAANNRNGILVSELLLGKQTNAKMPFLKSSKRARKNTCKKAKTIQASQAFRLISSILTA